MTDDVHGEEAIWQDLIARLTAPAVAQDAPPPWPAREELPVSAEDHPAGSGEGDRAAAGAAELRGAGSPGADATQPGAVDPIPGVIPAPPKIRIVRPAVPQPLPAEDDDHYVPPPPPPLPQLDAASKGAWVALFGGPGYLLVAILLGWVVPGWAAFLAVAAFVGGFATLVVRLGDHASTDSGPDDGAVV